MSTIENQAEKTSISSEEVSAILKAGKTTLDDIIRGAAEYLSANKNASDKIAAFLKTGTIDPNQFKTNPIPQWVLDLMSTEWLNVEPVRDIDSSGRVTRYRLTVKEKDSFKRDDQAHIVALACANKLAIDSKDMSDMDEDGNQKTLAYIVRAAQERKAKGTKSE